MWSGPRRGTDHHDGGDREHARRVGVRAQQRLDGRGAAHHGRGLPARRTPDLGIAYEQSLIGQEYLATCPPRASTPACASPVRWPSRRSTTRSGAAMEELPRGEPDAIFHVGFGLGLLGMNEALDAIGWKPPRYTTTAFEFAATGARCGCGSSPVGSGSTRSTSATPSARPSSTATRRATGPPEYFMPVYCYDMARMIGPAIAERDARSPARGSKRRSSTSRCSRPRPAHPAPGCGSALHPPGVDGREYLVTRHVLDDGSRTVIYGTIEGLWSHRGLVTSASSSGRRVQSARRSCRRSSTTRPGARGVVRLQPRKVGVDAGTLVGPRAHGVLATDDPPRSSRSTPTWCCTPQQGSRRQHEHRRHRRVAGVGEERHHHHVVQPPADVRQARRAHRGGVHATGTRFHAAGEHPGFMFERLATTLTGLSKTIDKITLQEFVDCSACRPGRCSST